MSPNAMVSVEIILKAIVPYIIPSLLMPWPLIQLKKSLISVQAKKLRSQIETIIYVCWAYIILNIPYTIAYIVQLTTWTQVVSMMTDSS